MADIAMPEPDLPFAGFPVAALDFYEDLADDNSRTFWLAHKDSYTELVLQPIQSLASRLHAEFGPAKIFRPYRDVRFAKDKTPYKTQQGVWFGSSDRYFHIDAQGLLVGGGLYWMSPDQLIRYRRALDVPLTAEQLHRAIAACTKLGMTLGGQQLSRVPAGYPKDHPESELIRYKTLTVGVQLGAPDWLSKPQAETEIVRRFRAMAPLIGWLNSHVGPAEESPRRR